MKQVLVIIITLLLSSKLSAQNYIVKGKILTLDELPLPFAKVIVYDNNDTLYTQTTKAGDFEVKLQKGEFILMINYFGKTLVKEKLEVSHNMTFKKIIANKSLLIEEILVKSHKNIIESRIDRTIFNISNYPIMTGSNSLEALSITPGLHVNNDAIQMLGKNSMRVMINDNILQMSGELLINYLKNLPSDQIKSIEVITNPPSKYSAERNSGIINIVLKKQIPENWNIGINTSYQQGILGRNSNSLNFNYRKGKISFSSNINYNIGKYKGDELIEINYPTVLMTSETASKSDIKSLSGRISVDYNINKKWSFGGNYNFNNNKPYVTSNDLSNQYLLDGSFKSYKTTGNTNKNKVFNSINFHSEYKIDSLGKQLNIDLDYFNYSDQSNHLFNVYLEDKNIEISKNENNSKQNIENYSINIDINYPTKFIDLNFGARLSQTNTKNELFSDVKQTKIVQEDYFKYYEGVQALYVSASKNINKKISLKIGIRGESTVGKTNSIYIGSKYNFNYIKVFPTFYFQYNVNENNKLSFNYGRRINRPSFSNLNPFQIYSSPFSFWEGNPKINPSYSNNLEAIYIHKGILQSVIYYEATQDMYGGILLLNDYNLTQKTTQLNYANAYTYGFRQTYVYNKAKWFQAYITGYIGYQESKSTIYPLTPLYSKGIFSIISLYGDFKFNRTTNFGFNFIHKFPSNSLDIVKNRANSNFSLFIKKIIKKDFSLALILITFLKRTCLILLLTEITSILTQEGITTLDT